MAEPTPPPPDGPQRRPAGTPFAPYTSYPAVPGPALAPPAGSPPAGAPPAGAPPPGTGWHAQPYPVPPYYAGPMAPATSGWAIASVICSVAGVFGFWLVGQVLGIIFGHLALGEIARSRGAIEGRGMALTGLIIGYVTLGLGLLAACLFLLLLPLLAHRLVPSVPR